MGRKIDVTQALVTLAGDPIQQGGEAVTLRGVLTTALLQTGQGEQLTSKQQLERYLSAQRIYQRDEIEFTSEEIVLLKDQVAKFYMPLVTGQVALILEGGSHGDRELDP